MISVGIGKTSVATSSASLRVSFKCFILFNDKKFCSKILSIHLNILNLCYIINKK